MWHANCAVRYTMYLLFCMKKDVLPNVLGTGLYEFVYSWRKGKVSLTEKPMIGLILVRAMLEQIASSRSTSGYGDPPLTRGRSGENRMASTSGSVIPACAGERHFFQLSHLFDWGHPRVCGGEIIDIAVERTFLGSSPRVRGRAVRALLPALDSGLSRLRGGGFRQSRLST